MTDDQKGCTKCDGYGRVAIHVCCGRRDWQGECCGDAEMGDEYCDCRVGKLVAEEDKEPTP